jgi:hypothetical protein
MKPRALLATVATVTLLVSGCASTSSTSTSDQADRPSASTSPGMAGMSEQEMKSMDAGSGPSQTATMICGDEIRSTVQRTFALTSPPRSSHTWADGLFSCTYELPHGMLRLSVKDSLTMKPGRAYFQQLRRRLEGASTIRGVPSLGFPAFETPQGDTAFLKDGKTLRVDASSLPTSTLPAGFSRQDASYAIASAVIACWTE